MSDNTKENLKKKIVFLESISVSERESSTVFNAIKGSSKKRIET